MGPETMLPMQFDHEVHHRSRFRHLELLAGASESSRRRRWYLGWATGIVLSLLFIWLSLLYLLGKPSNTSLEFPSTYPKDSESTSPEDQDLWRGRASRVRDSFVDAYSFYEAAAWPHDELLPLTNGSIDNFNGWGLTMVDSLDTMLIMKLHELSNKTIAHISRLEFDKNQNVKFFETVIRYLGGLLSSYALSHHPILLSRADDLGRQLLPAFDTPSGLPAFSINLKSKSTQNGWNGNGLFLSEIASCQLEYRYLGHLTGRSEYVKHVDRVSKILRDSQTPDGLLPLAYNKITGDVQGEHRFAVGAFADSGYEYLLKQWVLTNRTETKFRDTYVTAANGIIDKLTYISSSRELLYVTDINDDGPSGYLEHLSCFLGGLLSLGAAMIPDLSPRHLWAAKGLAHTCYISYADTLTGMGPDQLLFEGASKGERWVTRVDEWENAGRKGGVPPGVNRATAAAEGQPREYEIKDSYNPLRPETVESFYYLWRTTKDPIWRHRGWEIFQSIEKHCKTAHGYASLSDVDVLPPILKDEMASFFLAETLKYLYLLFTDEDILPLDKWTFTTEAHPLPVFEWSDWEIEDFGIEM